MRNYESEAAALRGLKPSTKVLALVLAARMNDRNDDWPGRPVCSPPSPKTPTSKSELSGTPSTN